VNRMNERKWTGRERKVWSRTPEFSGANVPVRILIDYVQRGHSLEEFLEDFPTVDREQAFEVLDLLKQACAVDTALETT
jgi:uncharacterized protein (DUF433 family)